MTSDEKIILNDPRTIYSLAMTAILFEIYKSDILASQNSMMGGLNAIILILMMGQISFLLLRGLSLAEVKAEKKEKILNASDSVYSFIFQFSAIISIVVVFLSDTDYIFNYFEIPKILSYKVLYFLIFLFSIVIGMYFWKKFFNITETKMPVYASLY